MFIKSSDNLAFVKSLNVKAFPCGRRRSTLQDIDGSTSTTNDRIYIPFDPEARLNTEYNNIKPTGSNGFTSSYINNWDNTEKILSLTIGGYNFEIDLMPSTTDYSNKNTFINSLAGCLGVNVNSLTRVYANIRLEKVPLYTNENLNYETWILRNQSDTKKASTELDLPKTTSSSAISDFYFSGLSFSTSPLTAIVRNDPTPIANITRDHYNFSNNTTLQQAFSLCILEKQGGIWQVHNPALLPKIEHGTTANSIKVDTLNVNKLTRNVSGSEVPLTSLKVVQNSNKYKLTFTSSNK